MKLLDAFTCRGVLHVRRPIGFRVCSMEDVGRYLRQMWDDFQKALQTHVTPGEKFGREAVYMFLVGTVPAFLAGSTSAALLLGVAPGFIAGLGMIVAFTHCQSKRSRERRMKVRQLAIATTFMHSGGVGLYTFCGTSYCRFASCF